MAIATTAADVFAALRQAWEFNDAEAILAAYADDAVLIGYSERNRPSSAERLQGRAAIEPFVRDVVARNLQHTLGDEVVGDDRFAAIETCVYPSGEQVVSAMVCDVRDGRIVRQVGVEAWDE
jgi:uncharacterized protein (TIGR02246 family)